MTTFPSEVSFSPGADYLSQYTSMLDAGRRPFPDNKTWPKDYHSQLENSFQSRQSHIKRAPFVFEASSSLCAQLQQLPEYVRPQPSMDDYNPDTNINLYRAGTSNYSHLSHLPSQPQYKVPQTLQMPIGLGYKPSSTYPPANYQSSTFFSPTSSLFADILHAEPDRFLQPPSRTFSDYNSSDTMSDYNANSRRPSFDLSFDHSFDVQSVSSDSFRGRSYSDPPEESTSIPTLEDNFAVPTLENDFDGSYSSRQSEIRAHHKKSLTGHEVAAIEGINNLWELQDPADGPNGRPSYAYVTLIRYAILGSELQRLTLQEIYEAIEMRYPFFRKAGKGWKNSVRHNLSLNKCFKREMRTVMEPGKGGLWLVDMDEEYQTSRQRNRKAHQTGRSRGPASSSSSTSTNRASQEPKRTRRASSQSQDIEQSESSQSGPVRSRGYTLTGLASSLSLNSTSGQQPRNYGLPISTQ